MTSRHRKMIQIAIVTMVMLVGFNNCSPPPVGTATSSSTASSGSNNNPGSSFQLESTGDVCDDAIRDTFVSGYYQFAKTNCATCHAKDADKPQFASPDANWAFQTFMGKGYEKFSKNAISEAHQAPYTGTKNVTEVSILKAGWQKGMKDYNDCKGSIVLVDNTDPVELLTLQVVNKALPALTLDQEVRLTWDLGKDVYGLKAGIAAPKFPGGKLSVTVVRRKTSGGEDYYAIKAPAIHAATVDIKVKTIYAKVNNRILQYASTFKYVNTAIRAGSKDDLTGLITTGALTAPGSITANDTVTLAFETLAETVLPPPPPPTLVNFTSLQYNLVDSNTDSVIVSVGAVGNVESPIVVSIEEDGATPAGCTATAGVYTISSGCLPGANAAIDAASLNASHKAVERARSVSGGGSYNRFDWDYKFNVPAIQLKGNNPVETFEVKFSKDIRKEGNRILRLKLVAGSEEVIPGAQSEVVFIIRKVENPTPPAGEWTFTKLMKTNGILAVNCVRCHNSSTSADAFQGGYDMTDYEKMLVLKDTQLRPVLIPGSRDSRMYRRLNAGDLSLGESLMPKDGPISDDKIQAIENWILNGAKNN